MQQVPEFHPSQFQNDTKNISQNTNDIRTLLSVTQEREKRLNTSDLNKLMSPGTYKLNDNEQELSGSNTKSMFKNLYGETLLTFLFFSDKNVENIQKIIRMNVYKYSKQVIDNQSNTELLIVMRSIFLAYSEHPQLIDETMSEEVKKKLLLDYTNEVDRLNQLVINICVPLIVSQLQQYIVYLEDASSPLKVMEKPQNTSVTGTRNYRSQTQVLLGGDL